MKKNTLPFLSLWISSLLYSNAVVAIETGVKLNDIHSKLNATQVLKVVKPRSIAEIQAIIHQARKNGQSISISGGQHSMGGQQFGTGTINVNMSEYNKVLSLDSQRGIVEVESGIQWPQLIHWLQTHQQGNKYIWAIKQKQTGADALSIGGALSSNVHGRGLNMGPIIYDIEAFTLVDANGKLLFCSRKEHPELFKLVIGGYGLFGIIATVKIRLAPVVTLQRNVQLVTINDFIPLVTKRTQEGFTYGDFQFAIDADSDAFMNEGIASFYKPVNTELTSNQAIKELSEKDWSSLLYLAHTDKTKAFEQYSKFYLTSNGQLYRSDTFQLSVYIDNYHDKFDPNSSEMISEIYVPRNKLAALFADLRYDFRKNKVNLIYGTVRLILKDNQSYLPWAKADYASIVVNFHVDHSPEGIAKAQQDFQLLIDRALHYGGSYFLTYHRWASKDQVLRAYPQFISFLRLKQKYDPTGVFQSDWYRYYQNLFKKELENEKK
ncbi:FAD-binding oxidoreductase [Legionella anisa]|uniref:FAD-binding oxidoreductase n=1 Tax=Legionella anisa TaxID=28082 RepID=A0AAX0WS65_9GAMM|nr:FAD-binding oxidoreductase [Legionella anisa]AWN74860.1 FAD-binding oxidoreductase [Legionella anisa]KTC68943.1 cytokinin oxidase [Legionella anisa]MBN5937066.1 FAD-binding oxidoreductase [Legionella anisa]MCW8424940.1 FAD-binding oxidoreductase [Legionella anisa]MCW8445940.1 FAD-binding oxidoreductase [Legionella anisa]